MLIEIFIIFIIVFGLTNLIRFIIDIAYKKEMVNDSKGTIPAFILGYVVFEGLGFFENFYNISNLNNTLSTIIFFVLFLISCSLALAFWSNLEDLFENKILEKIMFHEKTPLSRSENEDTFLYFKFTDTSSSKSITGDKNTRKLFKKLIEKKYNLLALKNNYFLIDNSLDMELFESDEEVKEIINNYGLYNSYLIKIEDGEISSLKEDFIDNLFESKKEKISGEGTGIDWGPDIMERFSGDTLILSGTGPMNDFEPYENSRILESEGIKNVLIEDGITKIGVGAFAENCLISVTIGNSIETIGEGAFVINSLTSVKIGNSVETIGYGAFSDNALTSVKIPDSVTTIGYGAFSDNALTSVKIPDSVTTIGTHAFSYNELTSVKIPDSVETIGTHAFSHNELTSVKIPDSVETIGDRAFYNNALTLITIPNSVNTIEDWAFAENDLTTVNIPDSVTTLGTDIFARNPELDSTNSISTGSIYGNSGSIIEKYAEDNNLNFTLLIEETQ
jgi:hypothetical protein